MIKVVLKRDQTHVLTETVIPTFPMSKSGKNVFSFRLWWCNWK